MNAMRFMLWLGTLLFLILFFSYGYILWRRSKARRDQADPSSRM